MPDPYDPAEFRAVATSVVDLLTAHLAQMGAGGDGVPVLAKTPPADEAELWRQRLCEAPDARALFAEVIERSQNWCSEAKRWR